MRLGRQSPRRDVALIVSPRFLPMLGGMERECALLADEFAGRGWHPLVITEQLGADLPPEDRIGHADVLRVRSSETRSLMIQLRVALSIALLVLRHRRRVAFAIVRTTTLPAVLVGLLKRLRLIDFPTLVTAETGGADDDVVALARRPLFWISRALVSAHDRLNGICQANVDHLRQFGFPEGKITMIPNGIDTSAWTRTRPPEHVEHFLFLGRIEAAKGVLELLDAFETVLGEHSRVRLTVAGEGPLRAELERLVIRRGLGEAVEFAGLVAHEHLGELFERIDCLVLPSYSEGMPLSVLEAASHHRALVITDVGDIRRMFGDRIDLCRPRDSADLARAMRQAMRRVPITDYDEVVAEVSIERVAGRLLQALGVAGPGEEVTTPSAPAHRPPHGVGPTAPR